MAALPDPGEFGAAFGDFIEAMTAAASPGESELRRVLDHLTTQSRPASTSRKRAFSAGVP